MDNVKTGKFIAERRKELGYNQKDLAEKLKMLCDDKTLVEKYRDGVDEFILSKYSWQDVAEKTAELYKK